MIRFNRYAEAIDYLQQRLQKPSANRVAIQEAMGQAWELRGDFGQAINAYREAMMASMTDQEVTTMVHHVARCRKKRWANFWKV
jgi:tetratricopeptide (TPR) repeat protein